MQRTTQSFYEASIQDARKTTYRISFDVFDLTAKPDIKSITDNGYRIKHERETIDDDREMNPRYATCERGQFKLDGSLTIMPDMITDRDKVGWWSVLSNAQGRFDENPKLIYTFSELHYSPGITVYYDAHSLPAEVIVRWYKDDKLIGEESYISNRFSVGSFNKMMIRQRVFNTFSVGYFKYGSANVNQGYSQAVDGYNKVEIEFVKTAVPKTYVKVYEVDFGLTFNFTGDELMSGKVKEQVSLISDQVYPNQLSFAVQNYAHVYDVFNPSDLMKFFQDSQHLRAEAAVLNKNGEPEYISMGKYYLDTYNDKSGKLEIKAYGIINQLINSQFYKSRYYVKEPVKNILKEILEDVEFYIHPNVSEVKLTGYIPVCTKRDALKTLAIAACAVVKEARDGRIYFYRATEDTIDNNIIVEDTEYVGNMMAPMLMAGLFAPPLKTTAIPYTLKASKDTILGAITVKQSKYYNQCDVTYLNFSRDEEIKDLFDGEVITDKNGNALISYNELPAIEIISQECVGNIQFENYCCATMIHGEPSSIYRVHITGKTLKKSESKASAYLDDGKIHNDAQIMSLNKSNTLICSAETALNCANWYLSQKAKRNEVSFDWWAVASVEASDFIDIQTDYDSYVTGQVSQIDYDLGKGLSAKVKAVVG